MPITPKQALGDKPAQLERKVAETCDRIDEILARSYTGKPVYISDGTITYDVRDKVVMLYNQAGWDVKGAPAGYNEFQYEFKPTMTAKMVEDYNK